MVNEMANLGSLTAFLDAAGELLGCQDPYALVNNLAKRVCDEVGCEIFLSYELRDEGPETHLTLNCSMGIPSEMLPEFQTYKLGLPVCGIVAASGVERILEYTQAPDSVLLQFAKSTGLRGYACFPIRSRGRVIGTLGFGSTTRDTFSSEHLQLMRAATGPLAIALDRIYAEKELRQAKEVAESASRAKDHFLAVLSHELRTPLTPVLGVLDLLRTHPGIPQDVAEDLALVRRNVRAESRLIDDLLDLTRLSKGKIPLRLETVDVHGVIDGVLGLLRVKADEKRISLAAMTFANMSLIRGDPMRIRQAMVNLVHNAIKFTPENGTVAVSTKNVTPNHVQIEVSDTGMGISSKDIERIFDPFEQVDTDHRRRPEGLGLGLSIARSLVELHGGKITAESNGEGAGSRFIIELPTAGSLMPAVAAPPQAAALKVSFDSRREASKKTVLVVEDHPDTQKMLLRVIKRYGYNVLSAASVAEAKELVRANAVDLVLSDVGLPDESGLDLMRWVRDFVAPRVIPAVALSGFGSDEDRRQSLEAGFTAHLIKPVMLDELETALHEATVAVAEGNVARG